MLAGIASVQFGAAFAKDLFGQIDPTALVWLRLVTSSVILVLVARPRTARADAGRLADGGRLRRDASGIMNWAIYQSFARIPLGLAVAFEFTGPLVLAVVMSRRAARPGVGRRWRALGVGLLGFEKTELDPVGVGFALLAGAAWAAYILLSARTGAVGGPRRAGDGERGRDAAADAAARSRRAACDLLDPKILLLGAAVGLLSSVIPYAAELMALRSIRPGVFSILMSLEPAAAALAGMLVLQEFLSPVQWVAVASVMVASVGATRSRDTVERARPRLTDSTGPAGPQSSHDHAGRGPGDASTAAGPPGRGAESVVEFHHILSDDGTRLRAWTNDPTRPHRRSRPSCSATASASARGPGRRCCTPTAASASSPGTTAAPAARPGRPTPAGSASRSSSRTPCR